MVESESKRLTSQPALFAALIVLFFIWGFITLLNDLLVPILKQSFSLNYTQAMLVQFAFFITYFVMSLPMAGLLNRWRYKKSIITGLIIIAVGSCCFIPADLIQIYSVFLLGLFILATGVVMLQVSANPLVTLLGAANTASARLTLAQAVNSFGYVMAPIAVASIISEQNIPWIYLSIAIVMLLTAFFIIARCDFKMLYVNQETTVEDVQQSGSLWENTSFVLALIAIFLYVGAEVSAGSLVVSYLKLPQIVSFHFAQAAKYLSFYWGGAMVGRFIGSYILARKKASHVLLIHAIANLLLLLGVILLTGKVAMWSLLSLGLFNSVMFPVIFSLGVFSLPSKHLKNKASGWLIMAIVGGAIMPVIQGYFADHLGLQHSFFILLFCYAFIAFLQFILSAIILRYSSMNGLLSVK